jgi:hypothetical protein
MNRPLHDIDNQKSYASEERLVKALTKLGFQSHRHLVVCNRAGRFTAIFPVSNIADGNLMRYAIHGFMTFG